MVARKPTGLPLPCLLCSYLSTKCRSYRERAIGCRQRKRRKTPGRWPEYDLRALPGIEFGIMTNALQDSLVTRRPLDPGCDGTSGVGANGRIRNDSVGPACARLVIQFGRIKPYDQHLV